VTHEVIHCRVISGFQTQVAVFHIPHQQPGSLQITADAVTDAVNQLLHLRQRGRLHPARKNIALHRDVHAVQKQYVKMNVEIQRAAEALDQRDSARAGLRPRQSAM
jgi:hypothetical protein